MTRTSSLLSSAHNTYRPCLNQWQRQGYVLQDVGMYQHSNLGFVWEPKIPNKTKKKAFGSLRPNAFFRLYGALGAPKALALHILLNSLRH